jgi:hypothetical protein
MVRVNHYFLDVFAGSSVKNVLFSRAAIGGAKISGFALAFADKSPAGVAGAGF